MLTQINQRLCKPINLRYFSSARMSLPVWHSVIRLTKLDISVRLHMNQTSKHENTKVMKGITATVNYAVYIYVKLQKLQFFFHFFSYSVINPNHFINLLREIHRK